MPNLHIPFFSQLDESIPVEHQRHVCALACAKMIFDWQNKGLDFERIYQEAQIVGNQEQAGWTHETIIRLLRNHGVLAYRQEFLGHTINIDTQKGEVAEHTIEFIHRGIDKIKKHIDQGNPVFVSVKAGFSENKEDHMILIVGYQNDDFLVFDPILLPDQNPISVPVEKFKKFWKGLSIFVE